MHDFSIERGFAEHKIGYAEPNKAERKKAEIEREREREAEFLLKRGRCSHRYPPAQGRVEHSQRNSSQNYVTFGLRGEKKIER